MDSEIREILEWVVNGKWHADKDKLGEIKCAKMYRKAKALLEADLENQKGVDNE